MDEQQAARFSDWLAHLGIRAAGGESLSPEQAAEFLHLLTAGQRPPRRPAADISGSPMYAAAVSFHEFFTVLTAAGFTEDQALRYMAYVSRSQPPEAP